MKNELTNEQADVFIEQLRKLVPICTKLETTHRDQPERATLESLIDSAVNEFVDAVAPLCNRHEARELALRIKQNPSDGRLLLKHSNKVDELRAQLAANN